MATTSTFPTLNKVLHNNGPTWSFIAGEAILAGALVGPAATGVSRTVVNMDNTAGEIPIGVAVIGAASGAEVTVALIGSVVEVTEGAGNALEFGDLITTSAADSTIKGCVQLFTPRADLASTVIDGSNDTTIDETTYIVGMALETIAANGHGKALLTCPQISLWSDHAVV